MSEEFLRPTYTEIDLGAIRENYRQIKSISDRFVMPVVKANAYGHGDIEVAKLLSEEGAELLGVATIEEGIKLRKNSIELPILVLGSIYPLENYDIVLKYSLTPIVASRISGLSLQKSAEKTGKEALYHLKVDTGMGRIGVNPDSAVKLYEELEKMPNIKCEGIFTHLARADENPGFTDEQISKFESVINRISSPPKYIHAANTAGIVKFENSLFTLVRPGLAVYGLVPFSVDNDDILLKPAMSWHSRIVFLKEVEKGTPISYGSTWHAPVKSQIATASVGYADGYRRILSNNSQVLIRGKRCPVIGRVCMDMIMIDVTELDDVQLGDEVVLIGQSGEEKITIEEMADWAGTINYEIVTGITSRVPRKYKT